MNHRNNSRNTDPHRFDREDLDAITHIRARRRCQFQRHGHDPLSVAVHLYAETGELPGWDDGLDDDGDWTE